MYLLRQTLKRLASLLKYPEIRKNFFILQFESIYAKFFNIFEIQLIAQIIVAIEQHNQQIIITYIGIFIFLTLIQYILFYLTDPARGRFTILSDFELTKEYLQKYIFLDNNKVELFGTGRMQNIIFQGINNRFNIVLRNGVTIISDILSIIYAFVIIYLQLAVNQFLVFVFFFVVILGFLIKGISIIKIIRKIFKEINIEISRRKTKILMSKFEILQNNKFEEEIHIIKQKFQKNINHRNSSQINKLNWQIRANVILDTGKVLIFFMVGVGAIYGQFSISQFTLLIGIVGLLTKSVWTIRQQMRDYNNMITDVEKLWDLFDNTPSMPISNINKSFVVKEGNIKLNNISFNYGSHQIFENFTLEIVGGKKTAFVGSSGAGKTTLLKLLAGYITPNQGNILIDNIELSKVGLLNYYHNVGYLTQDPSVFDGTIFENLTYAISKLQLENEHFQNKIKEIINFAKCNFIWNFVDKWDTEIGERGIRLSGGQKQRIAIAKIMLKNPKIILLDEPTSAMDSFNEEEVTQALSNLFQNRTVIVVAHRLQTVKNSDRIIYLEHGVIREEGTHFDLIKMNGKYKRMLDLQSGF